MAEMDRFVEEMTRKGVLLATGGLDPGHPRHVHGRARSP